jgi:hypothetical protein
VKVSSPDQARLPAAAAEILTYMYDRSLDAFAVHHPPSLMSIWPSFLQAPAWRVSLSLAGAVWVATGGFAQLPTYPALQPDRLKLFDGYGVGGPGGRGGRMYKGVAMPMMAMRASETDGVAMKGEAVPPGQAATPAPSKEQETNQG